MICKRLSLMLAVAALVAFGCWHFGRQQPAFSISGKPVAYWLEHLPSQSHDALLPDDHPLALAGPEMIPSLIDALEKSYGVRDFFIRHRRRLPSILQKRLPQHESPGWLIRQIAAFRLGQFGAPASNAVPTLIELLTKPQSCVGDKGRVIQALGFIGPWARPAVPTLAARLSDTNEWIRMTAAYSLLQIGTVPPEAIPTLKRNLRDTGHVAGLMAVAILVAEPSSEAVARIKSMLSANADYNTRAHAAAALAFLREVPDGLKPILTRMMEEDNRSVRQGAAIGLARSDASNLDRMIEVLVEGLKEGQFQILCAQALGRIGPAAATAQRELKNATGYVLRNAAAEALSKISTP